MINGYTAKFFLLFSMSILGVTPWLIDAKAQKPNLEVIDSLVLDWSMTISQPIDSLYGEIRPNWNAWFELDSNTGRQVYIYPSEVKFVKENKNVFVRRVSIPVELKGISITAKTLSWTDTLTKSQVKVLRKDSPKEYRGNSPFILNKVIIPIIGITTGISFIVGLFYLRS